MGSTCFVQLSDKAFFSCLCEYRQKKKKMDVVGEIHRASLFSPCPDQDFFFVLKAKAITSALYPPPSDKGSRGAQDDDTKGQFFFC